MSTFGLNSAYINEMYYEFLRNPNAFDATWRTFFASYNPNEETQENELPATPPRTNQATAPAVTAPAPTPAAPAPTATAPPPRNGNNQPASPAPTAPLNVEPPAAKPAPAAKPPQPVPDGARQLTSVALRIAQNMEQSLDVPTATSFREVPVKLLEENRILLNSYLKATDAGKLSFTHLVGWALVKALAQYPSLNNEFRAIDGKSYLVVRPDVNLGLAIDLQRPDGGRSLVVPSIKRANAMDFRQFYESYEGIVRKARQGKLGPDDYAGTSITLTNPGTIGTNASVPRLMVGQGTIIATGSINYPAAYQAMDAATLSELGVSKVMQMTSTYDHRIIQGAESGLFLAYVQELLTGEHGFYDEMFSSLQMPYKPLLWQRDRHPALFGIDRGEMIREQQRILQMINSYRMRGHFHAHLDPLGSEVQYQPELDPATYGLTIWDFDRRFSAGGLAGQDEMNLRDILTVLRDTYTQRIGVEFMHIQDIDERNWLQERMERTRNQPKLTPEQRRRILQKLSEAEVFEKFLQTKYTGHKRFSLEGSETMIPMIEEMVYAAAEDGVKEVLIGMAHRGRLNMLANVLGKNAGKIFGEFEDSHGVETVTVLGSGDVKYHLGARGVAQIDSGATIGMWLAPNPSHLEAVNPVIEGMTRARQDRAGAGSYGHYIPLLVHGDAAFAGQGVVAEGLNMSQLNGYRTGGTIHLVINNQIGFTASPDDTRSGIYATDIAKMLHIPIFHVNADDPEASVYVMGLAYEYRQRFNRDVVVDLYCYRRHGHNETDEPSYTQPVMYKKIRSHPSARLVYTGRLLRNGTLTTDDVDRMEGEFREKLEALLAATKAQPAPTVPSDPLAEQQINPVNTWTNPNTGVPEFVLKHIGEQLSTIPQGFEVHPKLAKIVEGRIKAINDGKIDWALAESLAFGSLLLEGHPIRLSGQDSRRGTFSQRHAALMDQTTGQAYVPLNHLGETQAPFMAYDSPLSEYAVLGFEYGYAVVDPQALVLWEAQFGDFVNGAQIVIDQFISSSEDKWGQTSGLVMLLPHAFEGQGPEHSSGRLERFLTLGAEDNMQVVIPSTAAQYFHVLRRQMKREVRKPLIIMTPKSLLRDPMVASALGELTTGSFQTIIPDAEIADPKSVNRVVFCSGKVYYDLLRARRATGRLDVAIVRIEQLYPFPFDEVLDQLKAFDHVRDIVWLQEEPKNMGAWPTFAHNFLALIFDHQKLSFLGRPASGSPASGSGRLHGLEQSEIMRRALEFSK